MAKPHHTPPFAPLKETITALVCVLVMSTPLHPCAGIYATLKRLSGLELLALALLQQLMWRTLHRAMLAIAAILLAMVIVCRPPSSV
jgi:hypothetical protein